MPPSLPHGFLPALGVVFALAGLGLLLLGLIGVAARRGLRGLAGVIAGALLAAAGLWLALG